jgi:hydroxyethylthiazole kinase
MIISPPFLPTRTSGQTETDWLNAAMNGWQPGSGSFPITGDTELWKGNHLLDWHGGLHLKAPVENGQALPVCAVADGSVIFVRKPSQVNVQDHAHPLNYGGGTTSDGVVVIRHDTEIGVDANDHPVEVRFYSVYMHLGSVETKVQQGKPIYRKDKIGMAGHVYGEANIIHFEICCDDDNLRKLVGRGSDPLDMSVDGRTDVIFGEVYFKLPVGTPLYSEQPLPNSAAAMKAAPKPHHAPHTPAPPPLPPIPLNAVYTSTEELIVGLRYLSEAEDGGLHAGDAVLTTYTKTGEVVEGIVGTGGATQFVQESEGEYQLYKTATHIAYAYPENARPVPAAVYELLRFGRAMGPDALHPPDVPHWRKVVYPGGTGWVNLNAPNVRKFSEADFPPWAGWMFIDDDTDGDSRCNSAKLGEVVYGTAASAATHSADQARTQVRADDVQEALSTVICKVPSEWDSTTFERRWSWLKVSSDTNAEPMAGDEYEAFKAHGNALCFELGEAKAATWHFSPLRFIELMRRCGWLSQSEFAQCFPRQLKYLNGTTFISGPPTSWSIAFARAGSWGSHFNRATRRFGVAASRSRLIHLFSQVIPETGNLSLLVEGAGNQKSYSPYYGRGLVQLTFRENYVAYGKFRGFPHTLSTGLYSALGWDPDALIARDNHHFHSYNCADSACYYVVSKNSMLAHMDSGLEQSSAITVSKDINGYVAIQNLNGLDVRLLSELFLQWVLSDRPVPTSTPNVSFDWRRNSHQEPVLNANGQPVVANGYVKKKYYLGHHTVSAPVILQRP